MHDMSTRGAWTVDYAHVYTVQYSRVTRVAVGLPPPGLCATSYCTLSYVSIIELDVGMMPLAGQLDNRLISELIELGTLT